MAEIGIEGKRKLKNRDNHNCFGCSPGNIHGLRLEFYTDEQSVYTETIVPAHLCGYDDLVHGGIVSTILDEVMSWTAIAMLKTFILTKSMTVDFLKPVYVGKTLRAKGDVIEKVSDREAVISAELYDAEGRLCARSRGTFALISFDYAKRKGMIREEDISSYMNLITV